MEIVNNPFPLFFINFNQKHNECENSITVNLCNTQLWRRQKQQQQYKAFRTLSFAITFKHSSCYWDNAVSKFSIAKCTCYVKAKEFRGV